MRETARPMHYRIDHAAVTHEEIEGEVIAVQLNTGCYFSLRGVAAEVWSMLEAPRAPEEIEAELAVRYDVDAGADVATFVAALEKSALIVPADERSSAAMPPPRPGSYAPPSLERYDDLQDLLILDPIHDVGDEGWPVQQAI